MSGPGRRRNLGLEGRGLPREGQEPPGLAVGGPGAAACSVLAVGGLWAAAARLLLSVAVWPPLYCGCCRWPPGRRLMDARSPRCRCPRGAAVAHAAGALVVPL